MIAQEPVNEPEQKPEDQKPPEEPPVGTNIQGNGGPDAFGLSGKGGNGFSQGGSGPKKQGWGWYAGQVQTRIAELLRNNRKTRAARFEQLEVRIWLDATGRIQRASLVGSTGNASLDEAIKTEVLPGAQLSEPPPAGMPLSIKLRMKGIRPN
jgi:TonB family protein